MKGNFYISKKKPIDLYEALYRISYLISQPIAEIYYGFRHKTIPTSVLFLLGVAIEILVIFRMDFWMFKKLGLGPLYPTHQILFWIYCSSVITSPFWTWGFYQTLLRAKLIKRLTKLFCDAGLKSSSGRMPGFVFDKPIDESTRKLRLTRSGFTFEDFDNAKKRFGSDLQVWTDHFKENRKEGTIDLIYSQIALPDEFQLQAIDKISKDQIIIGKTRSRNITVSFDKVPHLLVAGQTDAGKSNFLRQAITTLYLNNKNYKFELIDMKGGMELGLFKGLDRVAMTKSHSEATDWLKILAYTKLEGRMKLFSENNVNNLKEFRRLKKSEVNWPNQIEHEENLDRIIVVIDEAFDIFMSGGQLSSKHAQETRAAANKIAAQGRAVGINLILATQRPDRRAIEPQTKANLPGKLCFHLPNNASSMTVLDNGRATDLPDIKGRALWQFNSTQEEVQVPLLEYKEAERLLYDGKRIKSADQNDETDPGTELV